MNAAGLWFMGAALGPAAAPPSEGSIPSIHPQSVNQPLSMRLNGLVELGGLGVDDRIAQLVHGHVVV